MGWSSNLRDSPESSPSPSPPISMSVPLVSVESNPIMPEDRDEQLLIAEAEDEAVQLASARGEQIDIGQIDEGLAVGISFVETPFSIARRVAGITRKREAREEWELSSTTNKVSSHLLCPSMLMLMLIGASLNFLASATNFPYPSTIYACFECRCACIHRELVSLHCTMSIDPRTDAISGRNRFKPPSFDKRNWPSFLRQSPARRSERNRLNSQHRGTARHQRRFSLSPINSPR